jgi:hypothetical protein
MTYIIKSTKLTQEFINEEISKSLISICGYNPSMGGFWYDELYSSSGYKIPKNWNEENLMELYADVELCQKNYYG